MVGRGCWRRALASPQASDTLQAPTGREADTQGPADLQRHLRLVIKLSKGVKSFYVVVVDTLVKVATLRSDLPQQQAQRVDVNLLERRCAVAQIDGAVQDLGRHVATRANLKPSKQWLLSCER